MRLAAGGVSFEQLLEDGGYGVDGVKGAEGEELRLLGCERHRVEGAIERGDVVGVVFGVRFETAEGGCGQTGSETDLFELLGDGWVAFEDDEIAEESYGMDVECPEILRAERVRRPPGAAWSAGLLQGKFRGSRCRRAATGRDLFLPRCAG